MSYCYLAVAILLLKQASKQAVASNKQAGSEQAMRQQISKQGAGVAVKTVGRQLLNTNAEVFRNIGCTRAIRGLLKTSKGK